MKKKNIIFALIAILLPISVKGLEGDLFLKCEKSSDSNQKFECSVTGNSKDEISSLEFKIETGENLVLDNNIQIDSSWEGSSSSNEIILYTDENKNGNFNVATFSVEVLNIEQGIDSFVKLSDIVLFGGEKANWEEVSLDAKQQSIKVSLEANILSSLTVDGVLIEGFDSNKTSYEITSTATSVKIDAVATDANSKISGDLGDKTLNYGNNKFNIVVTNANGEEKKYEINIIKSDVRELSKILINKNEIELKSGIYEYEYKVENEVTNVEIIADVKNSEFAELVEDYGSRTISDLRVGNNEILIKTKDNTNNELVYKIVVNRLDKDGNDTVNPSTGNNSFVGILALVSVVFVALFVFMKKYSKFPKKI